MQLLEPLPTLRLELPHGRALHKPDMQGDNSQQEEKETWLTLANRTKTSRTIRTVHPPDSRSPRARHRSRTSHPRLTSRIPIKDCRTRRTPPLSRSGAEFGEPVTLAVR